MPGGVTYTKNWLQANGFSGSSAAIMQAIIAAESGGNPQAKNVNSDGSIDRGLFQINNKWHPEVSDACAYNPNCAVRAALKISDNGRNFTPWSTFNNGAFRKYLGKTVVIAPGGQSGSVNTPPSIPGLPNPFSGLLAPLSAIADFFKMITSKDFFLRLGEVIVGAILIYMGIHNISGLGPSTKDIAGAAAVAAK